MSKRKPTAPQAQPANTTSNQGQTERPICREHAVEFQRRLLNISFGGSCDVDDIEGMLAHTRALQAACTGVLILIANFDFDTDPDAVRNATGAACLASTMASAVLAEMLS